MIAACGTELIIVDEIHNINQKYKQMGEASDTLKQLSEKCPGMFVYAGVDVEASGLLDGTRGRQISSRFDILNLHKFENTGRGKAGWADLLVAVENSLGLIDQHPEGILRHASHLHAAAGGVIGDLTGMVHMLAMEAIDNGTERLDLDTVFGTVPVGAPRPGARGDMKRQTPAANVRPLPRTVGSPSPPRPSADSSAGSPPRTLSLPAIFGCTSRTSLECRPGIPTSGARSGVGGAARRSETRALRGRCTQERDVCPLPALRLAIRALQTLRVQPKGANCMSSMRER